jgi:hypothetical protein
MWVELVHSVEIFIENKPLVDGHNLLLFQGLPALGSVALSYPCPCQSQAGCLDLGREGSAERAAAIEGFGDSLCAFIPGQSLIQTAS